MLRCSASSAACRAVPQARLGAAQVFGMREHPLGEDRGDVFGGPPSRRPRRASRPSRRSMRRVARTAQALTWPAAVRKLAVEQRMDAPVRRLLPDEAPGVGSHRFTLRLGQGLQAELHRVDEELLAHRKAHRQGEHAHPRAEFAQPASGPAHLHVAEDALRVRHQIGEAAVGGGHRGQAVGASRSGWRVGPVGLPGGRRSASRAAPLARRRAPRSRRSLAVRHRDRHGGCLPCR